MGEVMMSRENGMELRVQETGVEMEMARMGEKGGINNIAAEDSAAAVGSCETVRWERFLPKMVVRVLLVEADDSTRQIISALLRKCSYRVAAVSDGLKAWEVLKGRSHNIDLILTEVDLPSISGYALLSLIMEHEICKNIPVIMMSSQDSVSTVYKCMLRGATDFLVKPVRKNELRNLWQHVWRKQASNTAAGLGPPDESIAQEKDEATAENNATSNHSSGYLSCIPRNKESIEKGDAQSSCTKPGSETEEEDIEHIHGTSKPESAKCVSDGVSTPGQEECHQQYNYNRAHESEAEGFQVVAKSDADYEFTREDKNSDHIQEQSRASDIVPETFLREAIDLIGTFDNHFNGTFETPASTSSASKFDILPMLDLSLRRSHTCGFVSEVNDERTRLNHSDASAFSRYINKPFQLSNSTSLSPCSRQMDHEMNSEKQPSSHISDHYSDAHGPMLNSPSFQIGQPEFTFSYSQNRDISHPIPVRGVGFGNVISPYSSMMPSTYCEKSRSPSLPSQGTTHHSDSVPQSNPFYPLDYQPSSSQQLHSSADQRKSNSVDQTENKQGNKSEDLGAHGTNQSGINSFCNGNRSHHQNQGSGCNGPINAVAVVNVPSECGSGHEETFHLHEGASQRAMQREAALTKFRQKRKDRCFDKKVRYESRKKLAEQRPRVKGQFVRQLPNDQAVNSPAS